MSRESRLGLVFLLLAALLVSCSRKEKEESADTESKEAEAEATAPAVAVDLAGGATVTGKITFSGAKPKPAPIRMDAEPECMKAHSAPVYSQEVTINDNGTLRYVLVYVKDGLGNKTFKPIEANVRLDQKGCQYDPHVFAVVAGQEFEVANNDPTTHNIHPLPKVNREWNQSQSPKTDPLKKTFQQPEMPPIAVKCNIHPWMKSYIAVLKHPFVSVSSKDGSFEIKGLPPGTYTIEAWHEKLGTQEQKVTVTAKDSKKIDFDFKG